MAIRFRCNQCSSSLTAPDERAGARFKCPQCGREGVIPTPQKAEPATSQGPAGEPAPKAPPQPPPPPKAARKPPAPEPPSEPADEIEPVRFVRKPESDEGIDMTPMVDVTFLLLIFFMVTAAYALQKSIEVPAPDQEESSAQARTYQEIEADDDYVIIRIARDNTVWVNEQEAASEQEVLVKLREAREGSPGNSTHGPSRVLVAADSEALHKTVVMCIDAASDVGMENVRLAKVDEEDF
jgi:biopolymer transport protein ExbD